MIANPHIPEGSAVEVYLHKLALDNGESLFLVSDIEVDGLSIVGSTSVDTMLSSTFVTCDDGHRTRAKSVDTVMKELLSSIIATS